MTHRRSHCITRQIPARLAYAGPTRQETQERREIARDSIWFVTGLTLVFFGLVTVANAQERPIGTPREISYYFRQAPDKPSMISLPLEKPASAFDLALEPTIYAITIDGRSVPLQFRRVFDRTPRERETIGLSCTEVATAEYESVSPLKRNEVAFLSRDRLDPEDPRVFRLTKVTDAPTLAAIKRRLGRTMPYGFKFNEDTQTACADRPRVATLRFQADGETYIWHQTECTDWREVAYGVAFVGLYRVAGERLEPVFVNRSRRTYLTLSRPLVSDLNRNGRFEVLLDTWEADVAHGLTAELSGSTYDVIDRVWASEEGSGCVWTESAESFLRRR